jgi:serine/threonine protein kinase
VYITLAYHPLGDLQQYLVAPIPEVEAKHITDQLLEGLKHMHDNGFAHRDLKPKVGSLSFLH